MTVPHFQGEAIGEAIRDLAHGRFVCSNSPATIAGATPQVSVVAAMLDVSFWFVNKLLPSSTQVCSVSGMGLELACLPCRPSSWLPGGLADRLSFRGPRLTLG